MAKKRGSNLSLSELGQSVHASALSRLEQLRSKDFQYDPQLKTARNREKALMLAACNERPKLVRLLLAAGGDANLQIEEGATPLMAAATWNSIEVARVLLAKGADPNLVDAEGMTALDMAIQMGRRELAELLREAGGRQAQTP